MGTVGTLLRRAHAISDTIFLQFESYRMLGSHNTYARSYTVRRVISDRTHAVFPSSSINSANDIRLIATSEVAQENTFALTSSGGGTLRINLKSEDCFHQTQAYSLSVAIPWDAQIGDRVKVQAADLVLLPTREPRPIHRPLAGEVQYESATVKVGLNPYGEITSEFPAFRVPLTDRVYRVLCVKHNEKNGSSFHLNATAQRQDYGNLRNDVVDAERGLAHIAVPENTYQVTTKEGQTEDMVEFDGWRQRTQKVTQSHVNTQTMKFDLTELNTKNSSVPKYATVKLNEVRVGDVINFRLVDFYDPSLEQLPQLQESPSGIKPAPPKRIVQVADSPISTPNYAKSNPWQVGTSFHKPLLPIPSPSVMQSPIAAPVQKSKAKRPKACQRASTFFKREERPKYCIRYPEASSQEVNNHLIGIWKQLPVHTKQPYEDMATKDRERFDREKCALEEEEKQMSFIPDNIEAPNQRFDGVYQRFGAPGSCSHPVAPKCSNLISSTLQINTPDTSIAVPPLEESFSTGIASIITEMAMPALSEIDEKAITKPQEADLDLLPEWTTDEQQIAEQQLAELLSAWPTDSISTPPCSEVTAADLAGPYSIPSDKTTKRVRCDEPAVFESRQKLCLSTSLLA